MTNPYNKLGSETSPYLQQHADNPVNWYPWGEEALNLARAQNKPILLSIGYSACHWCHVMAHESFEDETTAALMNEYFINIKVDREERPDLDKIYQLAHQMLAGRGGGWPLTMFLTPEDQTPFFGGTYFPPVRRHGLRSFSEILTALHQAYVNRQEDIQQQNASLREQLKAVASAPGKTVDLDDLPIQTLTRQLLEQYDAVQGGFTPKPKFPHPFSIERTFRQRYLYGEQHQALLEAGLHTARKMAQGGLFDHIGGGFCRYSTDEYWMIPHFEKMLYDNGQLLTLYAWAYQIDPDYYFDCAIRQTATWLMREMQSPEGGYYSAQDADSEGEEGKYYVWTAEQIADALDDAESQLFTQSFGLNLKSNFEGKWYPHTYKDIRQIASDYGQQEHEVQQTLNSSKRKLYDVRSQRIAPATDEKILTSWNALMIRGMNTAARIIDEPDYAESARQALRFIHKTLWVNNRLLATYKDNKAHLNAYLDDYAYLLLAIIDALQNEWDTKLYAWSKEVANSLLELFEDKDYGGFYFTSHDHEQLILRNKSFSDDAMPSGNGIASTALQYLGLLSGQTIYLDSAEKALLATAADLKRYPLLYCASLNALDSQLHSATIIILRGQLPAMKAWQAEVYQHYLPDILCFPIDRNIELPAELDDKKPLEADVCAYICEGLSCREPITRLDEFKLFIKHKRVDPIKPQDK